MKSTILICMLIAPGMLMAATKMKAPQGNRTKTKVSRATKSRLSKPNKHELNLSGSAATFNTSDESSSRGIQINYGIEVQRPIQFNVLVGRSRFKDRTDGEKQYSQTIGFGPTVNFLGKSLNDSAFAGIMLIQRKVKFNDRFADYKERGFAITAGKRFPLSDWISYKPNISYYEETKNSRDTKESSEVSVNALSFSAIY